MFCSIPWFPKFNFNLISLYVTLFMHTGISLPRFLFQYIQNDGTHFLLHEFVTQNFTATFSVICQKNYWSKRKSLSSKIFRTIFKRALGTPLTMVKTPILWETLTELILQLEFQRVLDICPWFIYSQTYPSPHQVILEMRTQWPAMSRIQPSKWTLSKQNGVSVKSDRIPFFPLQYLVFGWMCPDQI